MNKKALLIAEKPSLMRTIQSVYNKNKSSIPYDIDFMAQAGHLLQLKMPDEINPEYKKWDMNNYPMDLEYKYKIKSDTRKLYNDIKTAIKSGKYNVIINAGDPDQEGELLIRETLIHANNNLPVLRFWSNDLTDEAVKNALINLEDDSKYDGFMNAALLRQHSDYSYGMNLTGAMTVKQGKLTRIGRVKAVIIKLLCDRENEIKNFVPTSKYKHAFVHKNYVFVGENEYDTEALAKSDMPSSVEITKVEEKTSNIKAPKLYKLSSAQTDAYKMFGMSAKKTLSVIQDLYEKQYVSYPRTDCEYISEQTDAISIIESVGDLINIPENSLRNPSIVMKDKSYFNNKAISEEGHTALIPTGRKPSSLTEDEKKIYYMILRRFVAIFAEPKTIHTVSAEAVDNLGEKYSVKATEDIKAGFELILNPSYQMKTLPSKESLNKGVAEPIEWQIKEIKAKCPSRYTNGTLVSALERPSKKVEGVVYKIGTPATRANIIEDTKKAGYFIEKQGKYYATDFAMKTVLNFKDVSIFNIETTGIWEKHMEDIKKNKIDHSVVEKGMSEELNNQIKTIKECLIKYPQGDTKKNLTNKEVNLICPKCGKMLQENEKAIGCTGWKEGCKFTVWKNFLGAKITVDDVRECLAGNTIEKELTSKHGATWKQKLELDINNSKFVFVK